MQLRDYQAENIEEIRGHIRSAIRAVLWQLPTGGGKTAGAAYMLDRASQNGRTVWFIVHRRELVRQSVQTFNDVGIAHGIVAAGFPEDRRQRVQICAIDTLRKRYKSMKPPGLIVWDECHHVAAKTWSDIFSKYPNTVHVGLTATPQRLDSRGLSDFFKVMVCGPSTRALIDRGYLVPYRLFAPQRPDLSGVHTRMGDYAKGDLAAAMDKPTIVGSAVAEYKRHCAGRRAIGFAVSVEASRHAAEAFRAAGIPAMHVDGETDSVVRDQALRDLESGRLRVVFNVDLFGEGVNVPCIEAIIQMRPTQSLALHLQQIGRGLRTAPGKHDCIILDHAGNWERHGLPDDERAWSLEGRAKSERAERDPDARPIRQCPACYAINEAFRLACMECGEVFPRKERTVAEVDGDLAEVQIGPARRAKIREQGGARTLEALIELGTMRGYKNPTAWAEAVLAGREAKRGAAA